MKGQRSTSDPSEMTVTLVSSLGLSIGPEGAENGKLKKKGSLVVRSRGRLVQVIADTQLEGDESRNETRCGFGRPALSKQGSFEG